MNRNFGGGLPGPGRAGPPGPRIDRGRDEAPSLPPGYLQNGYFDSKGNIIGSLITEWAHDIATKLHNGSPRIGTAQLRKYFQEARRLQKKIEEGASFDAVRGDIQKLIPYSHEAVKKRKAPPLFEEFVNANMKWALRTRKDFIDGFVNHFECIVAYFPETRDG